MRPSKPRSRRLAVITLAALAALLASAGPASAHVEASAPGAQAGTGPVTVVFSAAAESDTAGIVGVQVQLPTGITPDQTTLAAAPAGWTLAPTADGYEAGGPDLGPGVDLDYSISISQLPRDTTELPFKTLLRYSDGREDAWIELPTDANPEPENPAPTITVAPAPPAPETTPAPSTSSIPSSPSALASTPTGEPEEAAASAAEDDGGSTGWIAAAVVVAAAAVAGAFWYSRTRRSGTR